jgi:large subunit ribosomal protein L27
MSTTKSSGSTHLGRESRSKRLGVKLFAGQPAMPGNIIVRQRGAKFIPGENNRSGHDDTIYAIKAGSVSYQQKNKRRFDGKRKLVNVVHVK